MEVRRVALQEARPAHGVGLIVLKYTASGVEEVVDAAGIADVRDVQAADDVGSDHLRAMVLCHMIKLIIIIKCM